MATLAMKEPSKKRLSFTCNGLRIAEQAESGTSLAFSLWGVFVSVAC
jgi:hypothetical protein